MLCTIRQDTCIYVHVNVTLLVKPMKIFVSRDRQLGFKWPVVEGTCITMYVCTIEFRGVSQLESRNYKSNLKELTMLISFTFMIENNIMVKKSEIRSYFR